MTHTSTPPIAKRQPHKLKIHGDERVDYYYWLNERDNPEVISYLEAENEYFEQVMAGTKSLQDELYAEITGRIPESDTSAPVADGPWEYFYKELEGDDYPIYYRRSKQSHEEQVLLDQNKLAEGHKYLAISAMQHSPCHKMLAYAADTTGNEEYDIYFLNIESREYLPDRICGVSGNFEWSSDSSKIFYTRLNAAHRPYQLCVYHLGMQSNEADKIILEESDDAFYMGVSTTCSRQFIAINLHSINTTEVLLIDATGGDMEPRTIFSRKPEVEYQVQDNGNDLYILTNEDALNFRLMKTSVHTPDKSSWETIIPHSDHATLNNMVMFKDYIALSERSSGLPHVRIVDLQSNSTYLVEHPENVQELHVGANLEFNIDICRLNGNSLNLPRSQFDFDMRTKQTTLVKTKPVKGGFDPQNYRTESLVARSTDGQEIPLFLIYKKRIDRSKPMPVLLIGYGSYGFSYPLYFSSARLSLLDRGVAVAITHIRGGGEGGESWYYAGKLKNKKNTFHDFSGCATYLLENQISEPSKLAITGGSAGGLVVGNFLNTTPQLCKAAIAHVPFVDILTTILDDSLPLSVLERDEWGDPNEEDYYDYIKSYSPYDNTTSAVYPTMFVTAGLNDTRVGYWEPAKWVAKIRHLKNDGNTVVFKTEMHAGHGGKSGRYNAMRDTAEEFAFILTQLLDDS